MGAIRWRPVFAVLCPARGPRRHRWRFVVVVVLVMLSACTATGPADRATTGGPTTVRLEVGDRFDRVVANSPVGSTFVIASGVHRRQFVAPRDGDVFVGEDGAVVSGATVLDPAAFRPQGGLWVMEDRHEEPFRADNGQLHGAMEDGRARDAANHDLWVDDVRLQHVETLDDLDEAGEWYFDYGSDQLWLGARPDESTPMELAVQPDFVRPTDAEDVSISNVTLLRFATPAQHGVIHAGGPRWTISDVAVEESHGTGIVVGDDTVLEDSIVVDNGQLGVGADGARGVVVRNTEIARNGQLGYLWAWEAGGLKFKDTADTRLEGNHVHDNHGPGIWYDLGNTAALVDGNRVERNDVMGIFYEISSDATIRDNEVLGNGHAEGIGTLGAGIFVSISFDVLIEGNIAAGNNQEIVLVHADRREEIGEEYGVRDVVVRRNRVTIGNDGSVGLYVDTDEDEYYTDRGNRFEDNTYVLDGCERCFLWEEPVDLATWQELGNDLGVNPEIRDGGP